MKICVYCSSAKNIEPAYFNLADDLARAMTLRGHDLVYGGASVGLMGQLARGVKRGGRQVFGVIPRSMVERELAFDDADELVMVDTMRQRKQAMEERADAFLTLPGGFGTLEEFSEILVGRQLGHHGKAVVLLNALGFYDPLIALFDHFHEHGFARTWQQGSFAVAERPDQALDLIERATAGV